MKKKNVHLFLIFLCGASSCPAQELPKEVNPFIGTGLHGHTYPGATVPFGTVQLSPDTRRGNWDACSGYHYSDSLIAGFSHTHLSGTGCIDLGDILFYPTTADCRPGSPEWMKPFPFSHQDEMAEPGYYAVRLREQNTEVELTATPYTGLHRYRFAAGGIPSLVVDLAHTLDNEHIYEADISRTASDELSGMRCTRGWTDKQYVYFVARFSQPIRSFTLTDTPEDHPEGVNVTGKKIQGIATFEPGDKQPLVVQVGLSTVSIENARENLRHDFNGFDFDAVRKQACSLWQQALSDIIVKGGTPAERQNFYTAMYHCKIVPTVVSDANGDYRRHDQTIGNSKTGKHYSTLSLWDTFRTWHPLMTLLDTTLVTDIVNSMLDIYDTTGELPVWPLSAGETGTMIGYHSVSVIADAWLKGLRGFDAERALQAMITSAGKNSKGADYYIKNGFIPADMRKESVSCLLEFAYDDWCIARMAENLGKTDIAERFMKRSQSFVNVFDGSTKFFRGKRLDGNWETPFHPAEIARAYTEASAWQYRFFVPHDVNGLVQLFGGEPTFTEELDRLFTVTERMESDISDISGLIGQYVHGNEPSHHMAYLYNYVGQPWKTQQMVRRIRKEMYRPTPEGLCGNEDCGQMSAWYVMSSIGLYPVCPGSNEFLLTSPLFSEITLQLANGKQLTIVANQPDKNSYIRRVTLNGMEINRNYVTYEQLMQGGRLQFELCRRPDKQRGTAPTAAPYSYTTGPKVSIPYTGQDLHLFIGSLQTTLGCATEGATIRYTSDGSEPDEQSPLYDGPFTPDRPLVLKAKGFKQGYAPGATMQIQATPARFRKGDPAEGLKNGTAWCYYEGKFSSVNEMESLQPVKQGIMPEPSIAGATQSDHFGFEWSGWIYAPKEGIYEFTTNSDDGSVLRIDGREIVNNDGSHGAVTATGRVALAQGYHPYRLLYFEDYEGEKMEWMWKIPASGEFEPIPAASLFIK